jgi:hypothetical protein
MTRGKRDFFTTGSTDMESIHFAHLIYILCVLFPTKNRKEGICSISIT